MNGDLAIALGPWRDGKLLVMRDGQALPGRCAACNQPTRLTHDASLRWQPRGRVTGVASLLTNTRVVRVRVPLCDACRPPVRSQTVSAAFGVTAVLLVGVGFFTLLQNREALFVRCLLASACSFGVAIAASAWPGAMRVKRVEGTHVWLSGFSREYLARLPSYGTSASCLGRAPGWRANIPIRPRPRYSH